MARRAAKRATKPSAGKREGLASRRQESDGAKRFRAERLALGKIQVHFEFQQSLMRKVRMAAAAEDLSYTDYVRKTVGLPYQKRQRPRISLSFSEDDLARLARRYRRPASEPGVLKRCVVDEIHDLLGDDPTENS